MAIANYGPYTVMITRKGVRFRGKNAGQTVQMSKEAAYGMVDRKDGYMVATPETRQAAQQAPAVTKQAPTPRTPAAEEFAALPYSEMQTLAKDLGLPSKGKENMIEAYKALLEARGD